jgi:glycosyltransferase involved in cell wall biosynthesis
MTKVSVIIPAYNAANTVRATLDSVLGQTYRDFEVIVMDDGSTDGTVDILRTYGDSIRWAVQKHQGQAYAINGAIGMATGEYLVYMDADDRMLPTKLEVQTRYLDEHPDVDLVYTDFYHTVVGEGTTYIKYRPLDAFYLLQFCCVCRVTVMHRRACLDKLGLFCGEVTGSDDWDMWVRMSEQYRMVYLDQALSEVCYHNTNIKFLRKKPQDHARRMRWEIVRRAYRRRGKPFWLGVMALSAGAKWQLGRIPFFGERFARFWKLSDRIQWFGERVLLGWMATPVQPPERKGGTDQA